MQFKAEVLLIGKLGRIVWFEGTSQDDMLWASCYEIETMIFEKYVNEDLKEYIMNTNSFKLIYNRRGPFFFSSASRTPIHVCADMKISIYRFPRPSHLCRQNGLQWLTKGVRTLCVHYIMYIYMFVTLTVCLYFLYIIVYTLII